MAVPLLRAVRVKLLLLLLLGPVRFPLPWPCWPRATEAALCLWPPFTELFAVVLDFIVVFSFHPSSS